MITNGRTAFQLAAIQSLGIEDFFDVILISEREGLRKPDPRIFNKALDAIGAEPKETIFVGDHPMNDIAAAKAVGMRTIWKRNSQWKTAEADNVIDELKEVAHAVLSGEV
ncbi:HAD family hydrolase [Indiicoccus explosivorum]|uniref:HAD family hydrolase n=1 Tax=Indiicoccus explosivorum TaxID=1917864 RepID=UPI0030C6F6A3